MEDINQGKNEVSEVINLKKQDWACVESHIPTISSSIQPSSTQHSINQIYSSYSSYQVNTTTKTSNVTGPTSVRSYSSCSMAINDNHIDNNSALNNKNTKIMVGPSTITRSQSVSVQPVDHPSAINRASLYRDNAQMNSNSLSQLQRTGNRNIGYIMPPQKVINGAHSSEINQSEQIETLPPSSKPFNPIHPALAPTMQPPATPISHITPDSNLLQNQLNCLEAVDDAVNRINNVITPFTNYPSVQTLISSISPNLTPLSINGDTLEPICTNYPFTPNNNYIKLQKKSLGQRKICIGYVAKVLQIQGFPPCDSNCNFRHSNMNEKDVAPLLGFLRNISVSDTAKRQFKVALIAYNKK